MSGSASAARSRGVAGCVALLLALVVVGAAPSTEPPSRPFALDTLTWHLESSSDGIALYGSSVAGIPVVPVKAVMTIPGTIEEISVVLEDISRRGEWVSNFGGSVLLERTNDYDQVEYLRVDVPWPARDRSALMRVRITVSDDLSQATIAAASIDSHPADTLPKLVRAKVYASTFHMTQVGNQVEVVALVFIDPNGSVPKWIVNHFTRRVARATLSGLRRQVRRKLYPPSQIAAMHQRMQGYHAYREQHPLAP